MNKVVYSSDYMFELSNKAIEWLNSHGKTKDWCYEAAVNYAFRTDPILIECIETLGIEADTKEAKRLRADIISYADSCMMGQRHTQSQFEEFFRKVGDYNSYCKKRGSHQ